MQNKHEFEIRWISYANSGLQNMSAMRIYEEREWIRETEHTYKMIKENTRVSAHTITKRAGDTNKWNLPSDY